MTRTPEQVAADDALTAAIQGVMEAYSTDGHARIMVDAMTIYAWSRFNDDGKQVTAVSLAFPNGEGPPHYRCFGLLQAADIELQGGLGCGCDDDED